MKFPIADAPRGSLDEAAPKALPVFALLVNFYYDEDGHLKFLEDWYEADLESFGVWELVGALERIKIDLLIENRAGDTE